MTGSPSSVASGGARSEVRATRVLIDRRSVARTPISSFKTDKSASKSTQSDAHDKKENCLGEKYELRARILFRTYIYRHW